MCICAQLLAVRGKLGFLGHSLGWRIRINKHNKNFHVKSSSHGALHAHECKSDRRAISDYSSNVCVHFCSRRVSAGELFYFIMFIQTTALIRRRWKMNHSSASMSHDKHTMARVYIYGRRTLAHIYTREKKTWAYTPLEHVDDRARGGKAPRIRERETLFQGRNFIYLFFSETCAAPLKIKLLLSLYANQRCNFLQHPSTCS